MRRADNLIIKLDNMGDLVLVSPYVKKFVSENGPTRLIVHSRNLELADFLFTGIKDLEIYALTFKSFKLVRFLFSELLFQKYKIVLFPTYSLSIKDFICWLAVTGKRKKVFEGDYENLNFIFSKPIQIFSHVSVKTHHTFEGLRYSDFFGEAIVDFLPVRNRCGKCILVCPDASVSYRSFEKRDVIKLADYIAQTLKLNVKILSQRLPEISDYNSLNIQSLAEVLQGFEYVIAADSFLAHFAAFQGCRVLSFSNGNYYGRFVPYPKEYLCMNLSASCSNNCGDKRNNDNLNIDMAIVPSFLENGRSD